MVAAVDGLAIGVGTTLCLHCDLVYATPHARFQTPFVNLGLVPEAGSSLLAPQRFGRAKAAELLLLAEPFGAEEALKLGLVNAVLPQRRAFAHAMERAAALAAKPRAALLATRRLMRGDPEALKAQMAAEMHAFSRRAQVARGARGVPGLPVAEGEAAIGPASRSDARKRRFFKRNSTVLGLLGLGAAQGRALPFVWPDIRAGMALMSLSRWISIGSPEPSMLGRPGRRRA